MIKVKSKAKMLDRLPHQELAVETIMDREALLIEYGTGTGKTRVFTDSIKVLVELGEVPIVVAVPNSLMEQTYEEFERWCGKQWTDRFIVALDKRYTIYRRREELRSGRASVYLLSHESFSYKEIREAIGYRRWSSAFLDEASRFRNYSKRTQTLNLLGKRAETRYAFTGNLLVKSPSDIFYVMNFLKPGIFGTWNRKTFINEYCLLGGYMGTQPIGIRPEKMAQLKQLMDENRIKCELRDIRELPPREMRVVKVDMGKKQFDAYKQMRDELELQIARATEPAFTSEVRTYAARLQRLQEIAAGFARNLEGDIAPLPSPKSEETVAILQDAPHNPTIIWYWWVPERDRIVAALKRAKIPYSLFGEENAQRDFMTGKTNVFLSQLAKGGYGLNLPRAMREIYHSLPWDLDVYTQSQERNMRLNTKLQKGIECMEIVHIVCRGTADEYVRKKLLEKADLSGQLSKSQALELLRMGK